MFLSYLGNSPNHADNDGWNDKEETKRNPPCGIRFKRAGSSTYTVDYKATSLDGKRQLSLFRNWRVVLIRTTRLN
jgi:hypothetical protein